MQEVFKRIGIGRRYEEWFISDYEFHIPNLYDLCGEYESLSELNYLAGKLITLNENTEFWQAVFDLGECADSVKDLINLTENLDCFDFLPGILDEYDLGYYWAEKSGCYDTSRMGPLADYIDYYGFGEDIYMSETGAFTDTGYIHMDSSSFIEVYDGNIENIPEEYRIQSPNVCTRAIPVKAEVNKDVAR